MSVVNPDLGPDPVRRLADGSQRDRPLSRFELHAIFRETVRWELSRGRLSSWRRRRLVKYAAALRISAVEAGRLIQEARQAQREEQLADESAAPHLRLVDAQDNRWPVWAKLAAALGILVFIKLTFVWIVGG
jgi:hypothetical protein